MTGNQFSRRDTLNVVENTAFGARIGTVLPLRFSKAILILVLFRFLQAPYFIYCSSNFCNLLNISS